MRNTSIALLLALVVLGSSRSPAVAANLHIDIVHHNGPREPPPPVREENFRPRRGYVWTGGHYEWRHGRYVWRRGHYQRARAGRDWDAGRWDAHDDHYDWHRGGWRPHR